MSFSPYLLAGPDSLVVSKDPILKLVAAKVKWRAPDSYTGLNARMPLVNADGSSEAWLGALVENRTRTMVRAASGNVGGYDVTSTLEGLENLADEGAEDFELKGTTGEDKLETCETFALVMEAYRGAIDPQTGRVKFPQQIDGERNPAYGMQNYYAPGLVWARSWTAQRLDRDIVAALGKIDVPPGNPPQLDGNANWLLAAITGKGRGNTWKYTASWLQSGPFGWLPEVYARR
jgi:hypothetical protein